MKSWILRLFVFVGALFITVLMVGLNGSFQRKVVLDILKNRFDSASLQSIKIGLGGAKIRKLEIADKKLELKLDQVTVEWSLLKSVFNRALDISFVNVENAQVNLVPDIPVTAEYNEFVAKTQLKQQLNNQAVLPQTQIVKIIPKKLEGNQATEHPFKGFLPSNAITRWVRIKKLDANAYARLSNNQMVALKLVGESIYPKQPSAIRVALAFEDNTLAAQVNSIKGQGTINLDNQDNKHYIIETDLQLTANGPVLNKASQSVLSLQLQKAFSDESYVLQVRDIAAQSNPIKILEADGNYHAADNILKGQLHFQADQNQLLPFAFGITLPKFQSSAQGAYNYNFTEAKGTAQLECDLMVRNLSVVQKELQLLDDLNLKSVSDFTFAPSYISVNNLNTTVNDVDSNALFVLHLNQPFEIKNNKVNLQGDLVTCSINRFPLFQLLSAFSDIQLEGGPISAVYKLKALSPTELVIVNEQPPVFEGITLKNEDQKILESLAGSLASTATLKMNEVVQLEGKPITIKGFGKDLIDADFNIMCFLKKPLILSYAQNFTLYLHELAKQPIIKSLKGTASDLPLVLKGKVIADISKCVDRFNLQTLRLEGFHAIDTASNTPSVCMFNLFQPISVKLSTKAIQPPTVQGPLADLRFTGFRLSSLSPFIPNIALQEGELKGVINFNYSNEDLDEKSMEALGIKVMATESLKLKNLSVSPNNAPALKQVSLEATPALFYNPDTLQAKVNGFLLQDNAKAELAKGNFQISLDPNFKRLIPEFKLNISADLGQFKQQPCMQLLPYLAAGNISIVGSSKESKAKEHVIQMEVSAKDLQSKEGAKVDTVTLNLDTTYVENKKLLLTLPIALTNAGAQTKVNLNGLVKMDPKALETVTHFDLKLKGDTIYLNDVLLLADIFKLQPTVPTVSLPVSKNKSSTLQANQNSSSQTTPKASIAQAPNSSSSTSDQKSIIKQPGNNNQPLVQASSVSSAKGSPWKNFEGTFEANIKDVIYGSYHITDIDALLNIKPDFIKLDPCTAYFAEAPFKLSFLLNYSAPENLYKLTSVINLKNLDAGKLLKDINPQKSQPLAGNFDLSGNIQGSASDLNRISDNLEGQFTLTGGSGIIYVISESESESESPAKKNPLGAIMGVAGGMLKGSVKELAGINDLQEYFKQIPYDRINIQVERTKDLNIQFKSLILQGPDIYLMGQGSIKHMQDTPIPMQALDLPVQLNAKGRAADLLRTLGLVGSQVNENGYYVGPTFKIKGTLSKPNWDNLWEVLLKAASNKTLNIANPLNYLPGAKPGSTDSASEPSNTTEATKESSPVKAVEGLFKLFKK